MLFYIFVSLFNVSCSRRELDFPICSTFNPYYILKTWLKQMKKIQPHGYRAGKGRSILIVFSDCYEYFALILKQNLTTRFF